MSKPEFIPDIVLERYVLGELNAGEMNRISTLAGNNARIEQRIKEIISSNRKILNEYPPERMASLIRARQRQQHGQITEKQETTGFLFRPLTIGGFAAVCTVLLAAVFVVPLFLPSQPVTTETEQEHTRIKGSDVHSDQPSLTIFKKNGDRAQILKTGTTVTAHDIIQIQYFAAKYTYGIIFSIDGRGNVTLHFPNRHDASDALIQGKRVFLNTSFELDDAPGFERFFFITARSPLDIHTVLTKAAALAKNADSARTGLLELSREYRQTTLILLKGD